MLRKQLRMSNEYEYADSEFFESIDRSTRDNKPVKFPLKAEHGEDMDERIK